MQNIYVVFIASNYKTGRLIRFLTRGKYNHVALSLGQTPDEMYSFARRNYFEPFNGGFTVETPDRYLNNSQDVEVKVCRCSVSQVRYERILHTLAQLQAASGDTRYDFLSLVVYPLHRQLHLENTFTCISFVLSCLGWGHLNTIGQLEKALSSQTVYTGLLSGCTGPVEPDGNPYFIKQRSTVRIWLSAGGAMGALFLSAGHALHRQVRLLLAPR